MMAGGATAGATMGGMEGGLKGALIGAGIGGALGYGIGSGIAAWGINFAYGAIGVAAIATVATEGPEGLGYMAGGMVGGMAGYQAGTAIISNYSGTTNMGEVSKSASPASKTKHKNSSSLNVDQGKSISSRNTIAKQKEFPTGRERTLFLGKETVHPSYKLGTLAGKSLAISKGLPTFGFEPVDYKYEVQTEWAKFNLKYTTQNSNLILLEKTQIHGTEHWEHYYYFKKTYYELPGMPENIRMDKLH